MGTNVFLRFFGGIAIDDSWGEIPLIPLGQWLLPIAICLLLQGFYIERNHKIEILTEYRCGTIVRWWKRNYVKGLLRGTAISIGLMLAVILLAVARKEPFPKEILRASVLWYLHMLTMESLFLCMDLFSIRKLVPAALILIEGITFLIGFRFQSMGAVMYGMWGMYYRSSWYDSLLGFPSYFVIIIELILIMLGYYGGKTVITNQRMYENKGKEGI